MWRSNMFRCVPVRGRVRRSELADCESIRCELDPACLLVVLVGRDAPLGFTMTDSTRGVVVSEVRAGAAAQQQGVTQGMLLESVNRVSTLHMSRVDCVGLLRDAGNRKMLVFRHADSSEEIPCRLTSQALVPQESAEERERRVVWIRYYVRTSYYVDPALRESRLHKAFDLGWDGKTFLHRAASLAPAPSGSYLDPEAKRRIWTITVPCNHCDEKLRLSADCAVDGAGVVSQIICPSCTMPLRVRIRRPAIDNP